MRLLMLAPPGAGKGTQATRLARHFGIEHISGDLLRQEVAAGTDLGREVRAYVERGDLVPDEVVMAVVWARVRAAGAGFVLDGFPRTLEQAERARELGRRHGISLDAAVHLHVRREELLRRLVERAAVEARADDREAVIRHRLDVYDTQTGPLVDYYRSRGILVTVEGEQPVDAVTASILDRLSALVPDSRGKKGP